MTFSNNAITLPNISITDLSLSPVSPKFRIINISINILLAIIAVIAIWVANTGLFFEPSKWLNEHHFWLYSGVTILVVMSVIYHFFADPIVQYAVREQDIHFQSGLFFRSIVSQPILRVQHIELKRGPIERKAGLATLQIFSAGGAAHTFAIPGLDYDKAISLRQFIINHKDLSVDE